MKLPEEMQGRATVPLWPDAGQFIGLSRNSTYKAANAGEIPTLRLGRKILVPVAKLLALLGIEGD